MKYKRNKLNSHGTEYYSCKKISEKELDTIYSHKDNFDFSADSLKVIEEREYEGIRIFKGRK